MKPIQVSGPLLLLALLGGCSVGSAELEAPDAVTQESLAKAPALRTNTEATRAALLANESYRAVRANSSVAYAAFDQRLARELGLDTAESTEFLAILGDGNRERVQVMDHVRQSQGLTRAEVLASLKTASHLANPAKIQSRLRTLLGDTRYARYLNLLRNQDAWNR
jgi:tryptophan 2,3-dioxygenase